MGKGGVGKTTIGAALISLLIKRGQHVIALDADPNANLAAALGIPEDIQKKIIPISQQNKLIEERTGAKVKQYGQVFKLNPEVSDIVEKYATIYNSIHLLVLGGLEKGGSGCACPENTFIRSLITDVILYKNETLFIDMEAGFEHLGRATAQGVDTVIVVLEPSNRSISTALRIKQMAADIHLTNLKIIANKVMNKTDENLLRNAFPEIEFLGIIPYSEDIKINDQKKHAVIEGLNTEILQIFETILDKLIVTSTKKE